MVIYQTSLPYRRSKRKKLPISMTALLVALAFSSTVNAQNKWQLNSIAPVTATVSIKEDLDWRLISSQKIKKGDCIRFIFSNPYQVDAPETYTSFDMTTAYSQPCKFSTTHQAICSTIDAQTFQIQFTSDNANTQINGNSVKKPFLNPYSSREISSVTTKYFLGCNAAAKPIVEGVTSVYAFQASIIQEKNIAFESSLQRLAVTNAHLSVSFTPQSILPQRGTISLQVPPWYTISSSAEPNIVSSESMLSMTSTATFDSHIEKGFKIIDSNWDASSRSLNILYDGTRFISPTELVVLKISNFKNPVNKDVKRGFRITCLDSQGYPVQQSTEGMSLKTPMTIVGKLDGKNVGMLGDSNGQNIGRLFEYNKISFFMSSYIPLEQNCYFKFVFPTKLKLDQELTMLLGDGIFTPTTFENAISTFRVDLATNSVFVEACKVPKFLSLRPSGSITFSFVLMPDYLTEPPPVEMFVYNDNAYSSLVFQETQADGGGLYITKEMMKPGTLELLDFLPSSDYAFVKNVNYTVSIRPGHDCQPSTRIVIQMPENLKFNETNGCSIANTVAKCLLNITNNELTVTNYFSTRTPGGTYLKFIISMADNPIGARYAGDWGARTESLFEDGKYFTVDGNSEGRSFDAKPGYIKSTLNYTESKTFMEKSVFKFSHETEHDIPEKGFLKIGLPVEMTFPESVVSAKDATTLGQTATGGLDEKIVFVEITSRYILLSWPTGHLAKNNPILITLNNIRTPRSFRPSSEFIIETSSDEGYIIDAGGSDITVVMNVMNELKSLDITAADLTNGAVTDYRIKLDSFVEIQQNDKLFITTPATVGFDQKGFSCSAVSPSVGVTAAFCEVIDSNQFSVQILDITQANGIFELIVSGMRNPPNFRRSGLFSDISLKTFDFYPIEKQSKYDNLWIQTNKVAKITQFTLVQSNLVYGQESTYEVTFTPKNPINQGGIITLEWSNQVEFVKDDFKCIVQTYMSFSQLCAIDFNARKITINGAFKDSTVPYSDLIKITLEKIKNSLRNDNLIPFVLKTFDDAKEEFPIDGIDFVPNMPCTWPCKRCSVDKNYCYSCWQDQTDTATFLMTTETASTCKNKCDDGWTSDGNAGKVCQRCDSSCKTCIDEGNKGDQNECKECAAGFELRLGRKCVDRCPYGTFREGFTCMPCADNCETCNGKANSCTSCKSLGTFTFFFENKCYEGCPPRHGSLAGKCFPCEFPCLECGTEAKICRSCSQEKGAAFVFGTTCITECPIGFQINNKEMKCEGCAAGCDKCDPDDQRVCLKCESKLLLHQGLCLIDCPAGFFSNYEAQYCYSLDSLDISLIPFPCLIIAVVLFFLSYVGFKQKRKHLLISNWIILMGMLVHGCLLSQMILNFKYGSSGMGIFLILVYLGFFATNIIHMIFHEKKVVPNDRLYSNWRNRPSNIFSRRLMQIAGLIGNWNAYKLTYSGFWGIKLTPAKFSNPATFRRQQKIFLYVSIGGVYIPSIIVDIVGIITMKWGTQLYIQLIENIIIFVAMIAVGIWEQKKQESEFLSDAAFAPIKNQGKLNVMSVLDDHDLPSEFSKTREHLLGANEYKEIFIERKLDDLIEMFGGRRCKSFYDLNRDKTEDPRQVKTWPASPSLVLTDGLQPLPDPHPNNCYTRGYNEEQMFQMKFLSKRVVTKGIQSDNYDADQNLRKDAFLVGHQRELAEVTKSAEKKRVRGRKNRYFKQIDNEDHEAGVLLDDDDEGERANLKARNELLDAQASLEAKRINVNKKLIADETRAKAMMLTEENLRLKRILEDQRMMDAKDQREFQDRIMEEEKRRQEILAGIERARQQREAQKNATNFNLQAEKEARMKEIERMQQEHMKKSSNLTQEQRLAAEAQFNAERARLESEYNERMLQLQRQAAPSELAPKIDEIRANQPPTAVRLKPSGVATAATKVASPGTSQGKATTPNQVLDAVSAKKSVGSSQSVAASPIPGHHGLSIMNTADEASALDNSMMQDHLEFERRDFNEIDILGTLDRDEKGNIIVPIDENTGSKRSFDHQGRPINLYGFLVDSETGAIIHNRTGNQVFSHSILDERGNIPMPYAIEKFNFNPFECLGTFFYDDVEDPLSFQKNQRSGKYIDELGRQVSLQGFLIDKDGSVVNKDGVKRFDWRQFRQFGGLMPKLYNYYGKTFELQEVMGVFDRNEQGDIQLLLGKDERGKDVYVDKAGFMVNQRGYIVTRDNHICTREGKVLFLRSQLINGEFPKIFPFTRFNINRVLGEIEMDPGGQPILFKNEFNKNVDRKGRMVNQKGFFCDKNGNVVDIRGKLVFEKALLEHNGDIPEIFRSNILRSDSQSSLSRFMSEIDRDQRFDESGLIKGNAPPRHAAASDTSFESMMEDSPSKYDKQNMRNFSQSNPDAYSYGAGGAPKSARWAGPMPENIMEEMSEYEAGFEPRSRKRKRIKGKGFVVEEVTGRDIAMATAYGGVAKARVRKTGPRFATVARIDRTGLHTSQGGMRPSNPHMQNLTGPVTVKSFEEHDATPAQVTKRIASSKPTENAGATTRAENTTQRTGGTVEQNKTVGFRMGHTNPTGATPWNAQHQDIMVDADESEGASTVHNLRDKRSAAQEQRNKKTAKPKNEHSNATTSALLQMPKYDRAFEEEFEKVYKKDIDKFIDGSDFEVESLAGFSEISKGTFKSVIQNNPRMKGLEKVYLQRLEFQQLGQKSKKYRPKPAVKREFMDRFQDDPRFIAKGENLKFAVGQTAQTGSSGKKKQPLPKRNQKLEQQEQRSHTSLLGLDIGLVQTTLPMMRPGPSPENAKLTYQDSVHSGQYQTQQRQLSRQNLR